MWMNDAHEHQKKLLDPLELTDSCEVPRGYWESSLNLFKEQTMLLTTDPFFQSFQYVLHNFIYEYNLSTP